MGKLDFRGYQAGLYLVPLVNVRLYGWGPRSVCVPLVCVPLCPQLGYAAERQQSPSFLDLSCTPVGPRWCPALVSSPELSAKDKITSYVIQAAKTQDTADRLSITAVFEKCL